MEQLDYNLLFRWFVGLDLNDAVWDHSTFSKNRDRLLNEKLADGFFDRVLKQANGLMSDEHFSVDGTLVEAWASHKSFRPKQESEGAETPAENADNATEGPASRGSADADAPEGAESGREQAESASEQKASKHNDDEQGQAPATEQTTQARERDFHGEKRSNETHESTTDPEARLYRKGKGAEAKLCYLGHALMENRNGLLVNTRLTHADGTAERLAA